MPVRSQIQTEGNGNGQQMTIYNQQYMHTARPQVPINNQGVQIQNQQQIYGNPEVIKTMIQRTVNTDPQIHQSNEQPIHQHMEGNAYNSYPGKVGLTNKMFYERRNNNFSRRKDYKQRF